MKLTDFSHTVEFPKRTHVVYVLFYGEDGGKPFYVGETASFISRMTDYLRATFAAATDFKVGRAVRYLAANNIRIRIGYEEHSDRKAARAAEDRLIRQLRDEGVPLLNDLDGYDYRTAAIEEESTRVHQFCDRHILGMQALRP